MTSSVVKRQTRIVTRCIPLKSKNLREVKNPLKSQQCPPWQTRACRWWQGSSRRQTSVESKVSSRQLYPGPVWSVEVERGDSAWRSRSTTRQSLSRGEPCRHVVLCAVPWILIYRAPLIISHHPARTQVRHLSHTITSSHSSITLITFFFRNSGEWSFLNIFALLLCV